MTDDVTGDVTDDLTGDVTNDLTDDVIDDVTPIFSHPFLFLPHRSPLGSLPVVADDI